MKIWQWGVVAAGGVALIALAAFLIGIVRMVIADSSDYQGKLIVVNETSRPIHDLTVSTSTYVFSVQHQLEPSDQIAIPVYKSGGVGHVRGRIGEQPGVPIDSSWGFTINSRGRAMTLVLQKDGTITFDDLTRQSD